MRPIPWIPALLLVAASAACICTGCGGDSKDGTGPAPAGEDREAKALLLFEEAKRAQKPDKVLILKRLVGVYPDTSIVPDARYHLAFYLINLGRGLEAREQIAAYEHNERGDHRVGELYRQLAGWSREHEGPTEEIVAAWNAWSTAALERALDWDPEARAQIRENAFEAAWVAGREEQAVRRLEELLGDRPPENPQLVQKALVALADWLALEDRDRARARMLYEEALTVIPVPAGPGAPPAGGIDPVVIRERLAGLDR